MLPGRPLGVRFPGPGIVVGFVIRAGDLEPGDQRRVRGPLLPKLGDRRVQARPATRTGD
jgi:hypothetical protein